MSDVRAAPAKPVAESVATTTADGAHVLELVDVHTYYGNIHALKGVSLFVDKGEIVTLIGSNGAGKSTTLRTISGSLKPRTGKVLLNSRRIDEMPAHEIVGLGVAQSPEGRRVFSRMSVYENLELGAFSRKGQKLGDDIDRVFELFPRLKERRTQRAGTMSGGEQQMLAIGRALMAQPSVLLLDEPSMGLSPILTQQNLPDHRRDQRPGHDRAASRAERADGTQHRPSRLRAPDGPHHPRRQCRKAGRQRAGPTGLPRRDLTQVPAC